MKDKTLWEHKNRQHGLQKGQRKAQFCATIKNKNIKYWAKNNIEIFGLILYFLNIRDESKIYFENTESI
jgi:hypothetical protein